MTVRKTSQQKSGLLPDDAGVARDSKDLREAFASVASSSYSGNGVSVELNPANYYELTEPTEVNIANVMMDAKGATINVLHSTDGLRLVHRRPTTTGINRHKMHKGIQNLELVGPGKSAGTALTSVAISTNADQLPLGIRPVLRGITVRGFDEAFEQRDGSYLAQLDGFAIYQTKVGIRQKAGNDSGEMCMVRGIVMDAVDLQLWMEDNSSEWHFYGGSFDYSRQLLVATGGPSRLHFFGNHQEPRGAELGSDPGNYVILGNGSDSRAIVPGRDTYIDVDGNGTHVVFHGGWFDANDAGGLAPYAWEQLVNVRHKNSRVHFESFSLQNCVNTSNKIWTGPGQVTFSKTHTQDAPGLPTRQTDMAHGNMLFDGEFASGVRDPIYITRDTAAITSRLTGANLSLARVISPKYSAANGALEATKVGGAGTAARFSWIIPVQPGARASAFLRAYRQGITGSIFFSLAWAKQTGVDGNGIPMFGTPTAASPFTLGDLIEGQFSASGAIPSTDATWLDVAMPISQNGAPGSPACPAWANALVLEVNMDSASAGKLNIDTAGVYPW